MQQFHSDDLAEILQRRRKELNLTQEQVAHLLHCRRQTISHYERGKRMPDYQTILTLAELFDMTVDELLRNHSGLH